MWWKNKLVVSAAVFVILLLLVVLFREDPYEAGKPENFDGVLPKIEAGSLDKIEITQGEESFTVEKRGEDWLITAPAEYKTDESWKTAIVDKLEGLKVTRLASDKKEKHAGFEVDDKGSRVKAYAAGREVLSLIVGKITPDYQSTFVRTPDSEKVFVVDGAIAGSFKKGVNDWRDKYIINVDQDSLTELTLKTGKTELKFYRVESAPDTTAPTPTEGQDAPPPAEAKKEWKLEGQDSFKVDSSRINSVLAGLAKLRWNEVVDAPQPLPSYGLDNPDSIVSAKDKDGKEYRISVKMLPDETDEKGKSKPAQFAWVALEGDSKVYQIRQYQADRFKKDLSFFDAEGKKQ